MVLTEQQTYSAAMARIADMTASTTAWAKEHDNASHAELTSLRATPCINCTANAECIDCTAEKSRRAVLPHNSGLGSSAVAGGAGAGAATSASAMSNTPTAPAAKVQRRVLRPPQRRRRVGEELPAATEAPAALKSLDFIVVDLTPAKLTPAKLSSAATTTSLTAANWGSWNQRLSATGTGDIRHEPWCAAPLPKMNRPFEPPRSVLASFAAAIDTTVPGYTPSAIFACYGV